MTMDKQAFIANRLKQLIRDASAESGEAYAKGMIGQIKSRDAATLVKNTMKQTALPLMAMTAGLGVAAGVGLGIGRRMTSSPTPRPSIVDPSVYQHPFAHMRAPSMVVSSGPDSGVKTASTELRIASMRRAAQAGAERAAGKRGFRKGMVMGAAGLAGAQWAMKKHKQRQGGES